MAAKKKADELEMENVDLSNRLTKKEQELDVKTQEKVKSIPLYIGSFLPFNVLIL